MTTLAAQSDAAARDTERGALFDLELLVARRADALAMECRNATHEFDRELWQRAEQEVFSTIESRPAR